jgi:glycosyltransferase involved in cell wall biosynthesis
LKNAYIVVINDLVTDQRAHRVAQTLHEYGSYVVLAGRRFSYSQSVDDRDYKTRRFRFIFNRGFLFYASFNIRFFFWLLFREKGIIVSNDLDTLPACWLASRIRCVPLLYDSHEYFTEVPELVGRKFVRNFWLKIEKSLVPKLKYAYTVSEPIAEEYRKRYNVDFQVIRNLPYRLKHPVKRPDLLSCNPVRTIIYQGSLNPGRGLESIILSMKHLDNFKFRIFGDGPFRGKLEKLVNENNLSDRIQFMGRIPLKELPLCTVQASLGISLEENLGKNYYYSLPNKLFDYIQARLPVLVSGLPEMKKIVEKYNIGMTTDSNDPEILAGIIQNMMCDEEKRMNWKKNLKIAAEELCWENEKFKLINLYRQAGLICSLTSD